ncbi:MAG: serine hydrolase, partial [Calditrichaeota bacterium]|nr:serine hydrolase [Calditrichota bacterium]
MLFITLFFLILQNSEEKIRLIGGVVDAYHQNFDFSGNILVADSNSIVYQRSLGMANYELNVANTAQTRFRLASISKQFTAAALLILEQKSQVDFNQAISRYLPQLKKDLA